MLFVADFAATDSGSFNNSVAEQQVSVVLLLSLPTFGNLGGQFSLNNSINL